VQSESSQGECIPVSSAMRLRAMAPNAVCSALGVVETLCSITMRPVSSRKQEQLERSPRSRPMVKLDCEKFLLGFVAAVLPFFIAGLLYLLRFERVDNLGAYSIPSETGWRKWNGYSTMPEMQTSPSWSRLRLDEKGECAETIDTNEVAKPCDAPSKDEVGTRSGS
jgi:hypothetical protein